MIFFIDFIDSIVSFPDSVRVSVFVPGILPGEIYPTGLLLAAELA